jgi:hypothetical protein
MAQLDWKAGYAYTTGLQAFIYGFPYIYNSKLRHDWVTSKRDPDVVPYAAVNCFWHAARVMDASYRDGGCPNNDTLYSLAWLDLGGEPVILSHPDMVGRYFTFELIGFTSDNFDYVGQRTTGGKAGHCLHRTRHEPDPQPRPPVFGRRPDPDPRAGPRPRRRADHLPAARLTRQEAGTELAAHPRQNTHGS